ncbi:flavoprotein [Phytomonospora endophytica]|uniref:Phosphopantothenoylcysteine synthetase/decarboxylase n=1 Tax=Phytomonospora endophytica TaxID=714109 RepID=A0A841FH23_9ACTN|nr:flavoprotein [Phytomonospora endophytica]MBB6032397.1 phosphopantothenoylcysteine synthetase/decarboxylase [Phytomonospora endophytica]GIG71390.1 flavoprotein [Phytomonospora endophytica]
MTAGESGRETSGRPVLHLLVCGSPLARDVHKLIRPALAEGWDVWVVSSPDGAKFLDITAAESLTGHAVRTRYRHPSESGDLPVADVVAVVPASCNTVNKWAAGICDTLVLGLLAEALGRGLPIVAAPYTNWAHAAHPAFPESVAKLRGWGVCVLYGEDFYRFHDPGRGYLTQHLFPWQRVWEEVSSRRAVTCPP